MAEASPASATGQRDPRPGGPYVWAHTARQGKEKESGGAKAHKGDVVKDVVDTVPVVVVSAGSSNAFLARGPLQLLPLPALLTPGS